MRTLDISLRESRDFWRPGEVLGGEASWSLDAEPRGVEVRLFWFTEGRGNRDVGLVEAKRFETTERVGSCEFEFELPPCPYSYSGRLISIVWAIELIVLPAEDAAIERFVLGPNGEVELPSVAVSDST